MSCLPFPRVPLRHAFLGFFSHATLEFFPLPFLRSSNTRAFPLRHSRAPVCPFLSHHSIFFFFLQSSHFYLCTLTPSRSILHVSPPVLSHMVSDLPPVPCPYSFTYFSLIRVLFLISCPLQPSYSLVVPTLILRDFLSSPSYRGLSPCGGLVPLGHYTF